MQSIFLYTVSFSAKLIPIPSFGHKKEKPPTRPS